MIGAKFYKNNIDSQGYTQCAIWCNSNNATIVDQGDYYECIAVYPDLDEYKMSKLVYIKSCRNNDEVAPLNGFDTDTDSINRIMCSIIQMDLNNITSKVWTMANNSTKEVTVSDLKRIMADIGERSSQLNAKYNKLKRLINNCTTKTEVDDINW